MDSIWLIPLLPGIGAAINGLVGIRFFGKKVAGFLASGMMLWALWLSIVAFVELLGTEERFHQVTVASWIPPIPLDTVDGVGSFTVDWSFTLDPLSAMMLLIVTGIGFLIHIYSIGYIDHEPRGGVARFFCYLNLFCFFMLTLVLGSNFLVMFVGWEGVGLCSYLLIGFYFAAAERRPTAGNKAFIVNRIGDCRIHPRRCSPCWPSPSVLWASREVTEAASHDAGAFSMRSTSASSRSMTVFCCSSAQLREERRSFRFTSGFRTPWKARRRCQRADPRRHHGHRRHLHDLRARTRCCSCWRTRHDGGGDRGGGRAWSRRSLPPRSASRKTTSSACSPTRPCQPAGVHVQWRAVSARSELAVFHLIDACLLQSSALPRARLSVIHALSERTGHAQDGRALAVPDSHHGARRWLCRCAGRDHRYLRAFSGFFSKDEILFRTYLHHPVFGTDKDSLAG